MNRTKYKKIKKHAEVIAVEWLKTLVSSDEAKKVTLENHHKLMPVKSYYNKNMTTSYLTTYHPKWIRKQIKYLLKTIPGLKIQDITLEKIQWNLNH